MDSPKGSKGYSLHQEHRTAVLTSPKTSIPKRTKSDLLVVSEPKKLTPDNNIKNS